MKNGLVSVENAAVCLSSCGLAAAVFADQGVGCWETHTAYACDKAAGPCDDSENVLISNPYCPYVDEDRFGDISKYEYSAVCIGTVLTIFDGEICTIFEGATYTPHNPMC